VETLDPLEPTMRLVNPGLGETTDRLTILALKILVGQEQGKDITHFSNEHAALLTQIRSRTLNAKWFEAVLSLAAVNGLLWHAEDDLKALRLEWLGQQPLPPVADFVGPLAEGARQLNDGVRRRVADVVLPLAFRIQGLNEQRAELVAQINREAGDGDLKEKV